MNRWLSSIKRVRELTVFLSSGTRSVAELTQLLDRNGISILGMSMVHTEGPVTLRLYAEPSEAAMQWLEDAGELVRENDVFCIPCPPDGPATPAAVFQIFADMNVPLAYAYTTLVPGHGTGLIAAPSRMNDVWRKFHPEEITVPHPTVGEA